MTAESFIDRKFSSGSLELIEKANEIIASYQAQGLIDEDLWNDAKEREDSRKSTLKNVSENWDAIEKMKF